MLSWRITPGRRIYYWALQILGWGAYGGYVEFFIRGTDNPRLKFVQWPIVVLSHMFGSHALHAVIKGRGWIGVSIRKIALPLLLSMVTIDLGVQAVCLAVALLLGVVTVREYALLAPFYLITAVVLYSIWSGIYFAFEYGWLYRNAQMRELRLQTSLQQAELAALRSQVNPHFLFNCLNNVRSLIAEDPEAARTMLLKLSELLRHSLDVAQRDRIPLEAELHVVEAYLDLQKLQFESRLHWHVEASEESIGRQVPPMLLQQLVENAVKHGISKLQGGGKIYVSAQITTGRDLELRVENTGALAAQSANGVGLRNARERLEFLGGKNARLDLEQVSSDTVRARVLLPLEAQ